MESQVISSYFTNMQNRSKKFRRRQSLSQDSPLIYVLPIGNFQGFCYLRRLIGRIIIKYVDLGFRNDFSKIAYYFANSKLFIMTRNHTHYRNIHLYAPSGFLYHFLLCLAGQKYNIEKRFFFIHDPIVLSLPFLVCRMSQPYQTQSPLSIE